MKMTSEMIARKFVDKGELWIGGVVPLTWARSLARDYLKLLKGGSSGKTNRTRR